MSREILFRGKRLDNGEWIEGDLVHSIYEMHDTCVGKHGCTLGMHQVIPETVGQYTGLTDKNGTRIFEGDIISFFNGEDNTNYEIGWYKNQYIVSNNDDGNDTLDDFVCEKSIVIGNIYDNPELMEVSE